MSQTRNTHDYCDTILNLDDSIRFVGKIVDKQLVAYARRKNTIPYIDEGIANMAHYQTSVTAVMYDMFNGELGAMRWIVAARDKVKLITILQDDGILILSTELPSNHDKIVQAIRNMSL